MARFQFRHEPLLRLRTEHRDQQRLSVAEANQAAQILEDQIQGKQQEILDEKAKAATRLRGTISVDQLLSAGRYEVILEQELVELRDQLAKVNTEVERRQLLLVQADQEVRQVERLRELAADRHEANLQRAEQLAMDEAAAIQSLRSRSVQSEGKS